MRTLAARPMDPHLHWQLGDIVLRAPPLPPFGPILACAHFRTSLAFQPDHAAAHLGLARAYLSLGLYEAARSQLEALGNHRWESSMMGLSFDRCMAQLRSAATSGRGEWRLERIEATSYMRYRAMAEECVRHGCDEKLVLDVGGGNGAFALFLPQCRYVLADPASNGISATPLPFPDAYFDLTVTIDTLEHIPAGRRRLFLSELIRVSKESVFIIAPFAPEGGALAFDDCLLRVCPNPWTLEHIRYGLPTRAWLEECLSSLKVEFTLKSFATMASYFPLLLVQLLLMERLDFRRLEKVAEFYNAHYGGAAAGGPPVGYLIQIIIRKPSEGHELASSV